MGKRMNRFCFLMVGCIANSCMIKKSPTEAIVEESNTKKAKGRWLLFPQLKKEVGHKQAKQK